MSTTEEKTEYQKINHLDMKKRMSKVILHMCKRKNLPEEDEEVFDEVNETFTHTELGYMACCYLGLELSLALQNPIFKMLVQFLRQLSESDNVGDKEKQEDIMRQVMDLLNKK